MKDVDEFLAYAVKVEEEAALRFDELADVMTTYGNEEVAGFFRQMAEYSRRHLREARARCGWHDIPDLKPLEYVWPDGVSPEGPVYSGSDPLQTVEDALKVALDSEKRGHQFYARVAANTMDPEIKAMAEMFTAEEAEHVAELEKWLLAETA